MRIAMVGTCQVEGMAAAAQHFLPDAEINHAVVAPDDEFGYARATAGADFIITQRDMAPSSGSDTPTVWMPPVVFTGFQPDMFYLVGESGAIDGPIGQYHSRIALAGFLAGLPIERTAALYNAHIFAELGYFDAYEIAERQLSRRFRNAGFDLDRALRRWRKRGRVFMHTINHPTMLLLEQVAVLALAKLGLIEEKQPRARGLHDALGESVVGPVFAPIAKRIGVAARDTYLLPTAWAASADARDVPIEDYVARSYAVYAGLDPEALRRGGVEDAAAKIAALTA